jgi:hypothetical protein
MNANLNLLGLSATLLLSLAAALPSPALPAGLVDPILSARGSGVYEVGGGHPFVSRDQGPFYPVCHPQIGVETTEAICVDQYKWITCGPGQTQTKADCWSIPEGPNYSGWCAACQAACFCQD